MNERDIQALCKLGPPVIPQYRWQALSWAELPEEALEDSREFCLREAHHTRLLLFVWTAPNKDRKYPVITICPVCGEIVKIGEFRF